MSKSLNQVSILGNVDKIRRNILLKLSLDTDLYIFRNYLEMCLIMRSPKRRNKENRLDVSHLNVSDNR